MFNFTGGLLTSVKLKCCLRNLIRFCTLSVFNVQICCDIIDNVKLEYCSPIFQHYHQNVKYNLDLKQ